ncbi:hypothetical protein AMST5_02892 [freshwater sediment metagenome]|uniref:Uncharacterized protein n=1 Tax=freshwater sediment metagenome TaxID=556182 RepID=A0AA48M204_9ZZZZ
MTTNDQAGPGHRLLAGGGSFKVEFSEVTLKVRSNFAFHHLQSAVQAALAAYEIEKANPNVEHGPWFDGMLRAVPVAITMAAAALEANANEIVQDILDTGKLGGEDIKNGQRQLLSGIKDNRSGNSAEKYRTLAYLFDKDLDLASVPWRDAKDLVEFRNHIMHFKPAWSDNDDVHDGKLVKRLKPRLPISPGYRTAFQFPYGFMTYGCAKWCVETVLTFAEYYAKLIGANNRFAASVCVLPPVP